MKTGFAPAPESDALPSRWQRRWRWVLLGLTLAALGWLVWNCELNPGIPFLSPGPGKWITFPLPPLIRPYAGIELVGAFRRDFVLGEKPAAAWLSWRCLTNGEIRVNGTVVPRTGSFVGDWKVLAREDVAPWLRPGTNEIVALAVNQRGPPALSLELKTVDFVLISDETWTASVAGSDWRPCRAASATSRPGRGGALPGELTGDAWGHCWPWLCVLALVAAAGAALLELRPVSPKTILIVLGVAWALLFLHNLPFLPVACGFDAPEHLAYVTYIKDHHHLPDPRQGWEMFQPPLYYFICAKLLGLGHWDVFDAGGLIGERSLGLVIGAATLALVFVGLRLVFPGDWKKPLAGLALAAFLPAHICLVHYPTNETLSALFVTGALCVTVHLLRARQPWWGWYGIVGVAMGLALMSKASAVLAVPPLLGALALKMMMGRKRSLPAWLGAIMTPLLICLLVGGWHYLKLWRNFGNPFIGNWDPKLIAPWWQAKGYRTARYFFAFGDALSHPFFSGLHSFWDAFYTTLWGDGLVGGKVDAPSAPPWNYDLMAVGFILALAPAALVLTGLGRVLAASFQAGLVWIFFLSVGWLYAFAILAMSIKLPYYPQTKAFYGLPVLLPFCALGALGFEYWAGRGRAARLVLGTIAGLWLLDAYGAFWIRPDTVQCEVSSAINAAAYVKNDFSPTFLNILRYHPGNPAAVTWLASLENKEHPEEAVRRLDQAVQDNPNDAALEIALARSLSICNRLDEAVIHARRAMELAPEDSDVAQTLCALALYRKDYAGAVEAGRHALWLDPTDLNTHVNVAVALVNLGKTTEAISHLSSVVEFQPQMGEAHFYLGLCLMGKTGGRDEGISHLQKAVQLEPSNAAWQAALRNALPGH